MDCRIELQVIDGSPIGIAHGLIMHLERVTLGLDNLNGDLYSEQYKMTLCDLEEIANHLMNYVDSSKEKYFKDKIRY